MISIESYGHPLPVPGARILVERTLPEAPIVGAAHPSEWMPVLAPSAALSRWYGDERAKFADFECRYRAELGELDRAQALQRLVRLAAEGPLVLQVAVRDARGGHEDILAQELRRAVVRVRRETEGGDAACWMERVCPECGRFADTAPPVTCLGCGSPIAG
ncbi:DUF488 domain-containing protein [Streptomyces sp. NPDC058371]|uniref:DUF488 domain-containing protein n=1 Tax=Streptomyces sp. NPDC058371 TaxID=3346463 RepID=UPI0036561C93